MISNSFIPCMNRWVDVAEIPLIRRNLAIRFHIPFPSKQIQLFLRKRRVNDSQGYTVKGSIPCSKKGVFPPGRSWTTTSCRDLGLLTYRASKGYLRYEDEANPASRIRQRTKENRKSWEDLTLFLRDLRSGGGAGWAGSPANHSFWMNR